MTAFNNVFKNSADAMAAILSLHFPTGSIIDANYGHGVFYKNTDRKIFGIDIRPPSSVIADNANIPFRDNAFDLGVIDPPYKRGSDDTRYTERYGKAPLTEQQCTRLYFRSLPEVIRVSRAGIIVKCQDGGDGHTFYSRHFQIMEWMRESTELNPHDIAVIARTKVPDMNTQGLRRFFQQGLSYFLVYKWKQKSPFKPVRF